MNNRFIAIFAAIIIVFVGIFIVTKHKADAPSANSSAQVVELSDHKEGKGKTGVTLIEYGDYQCPACFQYYPILKQVFNKYKDQIYFQFRNMPLFQVHQNAMVSARAAEAAGLQNKYWEMHDLLYQNQTAWSESKNPQQFFEDYAQQLGLNIDKFKQDMNSDHVNKIIQADLQDANKRGFDSTPSFVLDGKNITSNPTDVASFSKLIDEAIKNKTSQNN